MPNLFTLPRVVPVDSAGQPYAAAKLYFYGAGTLVYQPVYTDSDLTIPHSQPVVADSNGRFAAIYLDPNETADYRVQLKTSGDVLIYDQDNVDRGGAEDIDVGALLYPITAAETAAGVTPADYSYPPLNAKRYGATGDGEPDSSFLGVWALVMAQETSPHGVLPPGTYYLDSPLVLDLPDNTSLDLQGEFTTDISGSSAIRIGTTSIVTSKFRYSIRGLAISRTSYDYNGTSVGVECRNIAFADIDFKLVDGFKDGILINGTAANGGVSYCQFHLGQIRNSQTNLRLTASGVGYCNENIFYGGSFGHDSNYPEVATVNLQTDHFSSSWLNNNRFICPSFEDLTEDAVAAVINGTNNVILWPRIENDGYQETYQIQFTANSLECDVFGRGFSLLDSNISDLGANTNYETREGKHISHQTPAEAGKAVLRLRSTATSDATLISFLDSSGVEQADIDGNGYATFTKLNLDINAILNAADDSAAASAGVPVGGVYRNGSVLMLRLS